MGHSAQWDFVRGLSMAVMVVMHTTDLVEWRPFEYQLMSFAYPVIEPIIFLSGFLICWRTMRHVNQENRPLPLTMKLYAIRRVIRTWPLFHLILALGFLIPVLPEFPIAKPWWSFATFTMNFDLHKSGFVHIWTLCLEEWCYFIFLMLIPFLRREGVRTVFLVLALLPLALRILIIWKYGPLSYADYFTKIHFFTLTHWDSFWWGCLFAGVYKGPTTKPMGYIFLAASALVFAVGIILGFNSRFDAPLAFMQITFPLWGALGSALLCAGIGAVPAGVLRKTGLVQFGIMSYTFYLTHKIFISGFVKINRAWGIVDAYSWPELFLSWAFMLVGGTILFFAAERHILRLLQRFSFPAPTNPAE